MHQPVAAVHAGRLRAWEAGAGVQPADCRQSQKAPAGQVWTQLPGLNTSDLRNGSEPAEAAPPMLPAYIAYTSFILFR